MYICMYAYFSNGFHPIHLLVMNCAVSYKKQQKLPGVDRKTLQWDSWVQNEGKSLMVGGHSCSVQRKRVFWMTSVFESTLLDVTNVESWISANLSPPTLKWWFCKGNLQVLSGLMNCLTIYVQKYGTEWIIIKSYWRGTAFFKAFRYVEVPWPPVKSWDYQQNSEWNGICPVISLIICSSCLKCLLKKLEFISFWLCMIGLFIKSFLICLPFVFPLKSVLFWLLCRGQVRVLVPCWLLYPRSESFFVFLRKISGPSKISKTKFITRWWFQTFFIFTPIWGRFPFWPIFLRWVVQPPTR